MKLRPYLVQLSISLYMTWDVLGTQPMPNAIPQPPDSIGTEAKRGVLTRSGIGQLSARHRGIIPSIPGDRRYTITPNSQSADKISFIGHGDVVQKIYKDEAAYKKEYSTYKSDIKTINVYNEKRSKYLVNNPTSKLPILIDIKGFDEIDKKKYIEALKDNIKLDQATIDKIMQEPTFQNMKTIYIQYMGVAKGKSLTTYREEIFNGRLSEEQARKVFGRVGQQLGNLHQMLNTNDDGKIPNKPEYQELVHHDSHGANFMYDENEDQLYWIDLSGIKIKTNVESDGLQAGTEINTFLTSQIISDVFKIFGDAITPKFSKDEQKHHIDRAVIMVHALQSLFNEYKKVVDQYKPEKLTMELVLKKNGKSEYAKYDVFKSYLKKVQTTYKRLYDNKDIDLFEGFGMKNEAVAGTQIVK